jgi:iron(III) transport system ATP-binding protein
VLIAAPAPKAERQAVAPALSLEGVSRAFKARRAVDDVTLDVRSGELFGLLGPSGSGKTTLLRTIAGFERPDSGTIAVAGRVVASPEVALEPEHRGVGFMPQGDTLFPHLSVEENVAFGVRRDAARAASALELVGLTDRAKSRPSELSGGERQRVALARALAPGPSIILLDEPFSSLDHSLRSRLRRDVVDILRRAEATGILVTHNQEEALGLADRVGIMRDGSVVQCGSPTELYWRPADEWTAHFLGDVNVLTADLDGDGAATALGRFATPGANGHRGLCQVGVRPEQLLLVAADDADAVVTQREFRGHDVMYELRHRAIGSLLVQLPSLDLFEPGQAVHVVPHASASAAVLAATG